MFSKYKYGFTEWLLFSPRGYNVARLKKVLAGKLVLITGASFGIGEHLAYHLAATGAHLLLVARTREKLLDVKAIVEQKGGKASIYACDLSVAAQVDELLEYLHQLPGGIDIVINNAGKSIRRSLYESLDRMHDFNRTMSLNYYGPVQLLLSLIPVVQKNQGQIVNVSSVSVLLAPAPYWAAYQASKAAMDQWFRCAAPELNATGVATSSVYLPLVKTRMMAPTAAYQSMPAMSPDHVAAIICRMLFNRSSRFVPWWLIFGQLGSVIFRRLTEIGFIRYIKKRH